MRRDGSSSLPFYDGQHPERVVDSSQSNTRLLAWLQVHFSKLLYTYNEGASRGREFAIPLPFRYVALDLSRRNHLWYLADIIH